MISALAAGITAGYGVALPIGPIATYLVALGVRERFPISAAAALGVATTDGLFAVIAAFGGAGLQQTLRPVSESLAYASAAILCVLALRTMIRAVRQHRNATATTTRDRSHPRPLRTYANLAALTALNPSTLAYFAALVIGDQADRSSPAILSGTVFALGALLASASWQLILASSGAVLGGILTSNRGQLVAAVLSATIMLILAGRLLVQ